MKSNSLFHVRKVRASFSNGLRLVLSVCMIALPLLSEPWFLNSVYAAKNVDYRAVPPFMSTVVTPNILFILDNSNSMDEDVDGAAVGSNAVNSKAEIARNAIKTIITNNQSSMRFGLMAYKQSGISGTPYYLHNSYYYASYDPASYNPAAEPTPKDPAGNTKRALNPTDADLNPYIYYDTALPFYATVNYGSAFCYAQNFTLADPETCTSTNWASCDSYRCYTTKAGDLPTLGGRTDAQLRAGYGYNNFWFSSQFYPTDSDIAAGFHEFGQEQAWTYVGRTWFSNSSPGPGMLHQPIADSSTAQITALKNLLATSQFTTATDIPLRNAGLTPLAGTMASARKYFSGTLPANEAVTGASRTTPVQYTCQQNYVILLTDGLPSVNKTGVAGSTNSLLAELKTEIEGLRSTSVPVGTEPFDIKTFVVGFAIPPSLGPKLDDMAVAGGTDVNGKALLANNAAELAAKLESIFLQISNDVSSGAAASVISNTRSGEGVVYQSVFYPKFKDSTLQKNNVDWAGSVHALFVDAYGNLREDTNHNGRLDVINEACLTLKPDIPSWCNNGKVDTEDKDGDGHLDTVDEDLQDIPGHPGWKGNGALDTEDKDGDGRLDTVDEDQQDIPGHPDWKGNRGTKTIPDTEDLDGDGHLDVNENDQENDHPSWRNNSNPNPDTEDLNNNGILDPVEDTAEPNGKFDTEDLNCNGNLDPGEDERLIPGHSNWRGNGVLDRELSEDLNYNCVLDVGEDINSNGTLDWVDYATPNGKLDTEDLDGDGKLDLVNEDTNGNLKLDEEDLNGDGHLDVNEDTNGNGTLDTEDIDGDRRLDKGDEDINGNGILDEEKDYNGNGVLDNSDLIIRYAEDTSGNTIVHKFYDANGNGILEVEDETVFDPPIPTWSGNGILNKEVDTNGNGKFDSGEKDVNLNGKFDTEDANGDGLLSTEQLSGNWTLQQINYVWQSGPWLNKITDSDIVTQRSYDSTDQKRHIITFIPSTNFNEDTNGNTILDAGEDLYKNGKLDTVPDQIVRSSGDIVAFDQTTYATLYRYLNLYPTFADEPAWSKAIRLSGSGPWEDFLEKQSKRVINYIRGLDQSAFTSATTPPYTLSAMRPRQVDTDGDGTVETWRLGDIIYSSPTLVGRPAEGYHLLYRDTSYGEFAAKYHYRRQVVYVGGNDGMLHAFNGGFYNSLINGLSTTSQKQPDAYTDTNANGKWDAGEPVTQDWNGNGAYDSGKGTEKEYVIGSELWAYIPYNLLPHLYWLTEPTYQHVYYMDLKPRVFDAKVFSNDADHPNGWGTIMVAGMRFGGGEVKVDYNKDGNAYDPAVDRTLKSAYVIFDITNPEMEPKVLAELTMPGLGYTTCYPTAIAMGPASTNQWALVFGSGPNEDGSPGVGSSLKNASSNTKGKVFMVDLKNLVIDKEIWSVDGSDADKPWKKGWYAYDDTISTNAFVSDIISVDYELDYFADALYFGTVNTEDLNGNGTLDKEDLNNNGVLNTGEDVNLNGKLDTEDANGNGTLDLGWGGQLRRIELFDTTYASRFVPLKWKNSVLVDLSDLTKSIHQPITAAPTIGLDTAKNKWVFFGTGRFYTSSDVANKEKQSYYGVKDTWATVDRTADLLDVTSAKVYSNQTVSGLTGVSSFSGLETAIDNKKGWLLNLVDETSGNAIGHRNLGQAALLGDILTFTSYLPSSNICQTEGSSELYACYYRTGTAYQAPVIGIEWFDTNSDGIIQKSEALVKRRTKVGSGMALSPNLHTGSEEGSKVFIQTSKGGISTFDEDNPGLSKSSKSFWRQR